MEKNVAGYFLIKSYMASKGANQVQTASFNGVIVQFCLKKNMNYGIQGFRKIQEKLK